MAEWLQEMTGCSREQADAAMREHGDELYLALESLLPQKSVSGDKYLPPKPRVNTGMTPEQEALCRRGRELQEKVNAVFSVAHSKTQSPPVPSAGAEPRSQATAGNSASPPEAPPSTAE